MHPVRAAEVGFLVQMSLVREFHYTRTHTLQVYTYMVKFIIIVL